MNFREIKRARNKQTLRQENEQQEICIKLIRQLNATLNLQNTLILIVEIQHSGAWAIA